MSPNPPNLSTYDLIVISTSAGKDSQAMMDFVVAEARAQGFPLDRIIAVHADLGEAEWGGTRELAERQARSYGLRFEMISRPQGDLLAHVRERGMWPSPKQRYCTSDHKRAQIHRVYTKLVRELDGLGRQVRILECVGLRSEESPSRAKKVAFANNRRATNGRRHVDTWLPIHTWTTAEVWHRIAASGVDHHRAYDLGMPRLSCVFCIFAPKAALVLAGRHNPELLDRYVELEAEIGHTFRQDCSLAEVRDEVRSQASEVQPLTSWRM